MAASTGSSEAKTQEAKAPAAGEEDLSMEEILHSIRKIISEDDGGKKPADTKKAPEEVTGSDVLELTEMIKEDGTVVSLKTEAVPEKAVKEPAPADVLNSIDEALVP